MFLRGISHCASPAVFANNVRCMAKQATGVGAIKWRRRVTDAVNEAKETKKPIMVCIHRKWCPACHTLMPKLTSNAQIIELSKQFVMVECSKDLDPADAKFSPDGGYFPR